MQISFNGINFLKDLEGYRDTAYLDTAGIPTIGYGTIRIDGKPVELGMTCTEPQAVLWLTADLAQAQTAVNKLVTVPLTQNQYDALVSFVYNVGVHAFATSTLRRLLNTKDPHTSDEFDRWVYSGGHVTKGLVARRRSEKSLFESK